MEEAKKRQNHNAPLPTSRLERCNTAPLDLNPTSKRPDIPPPPNRHLRRRNSLLPERRLGSFSSSSRPPISPALYVTPESTPLPDSPNSLPPLSPYVINHKRRGPRLHKSYSYFQKNVDEVDARLYNAHLRRFSEGDLRRKEHADEDLAGESKAGDGGSVFQKDESANGSSGDVVGGNAVADLKILTGQISSLKRDDGETDDFFDPQETMSLMNYSIDGEDYSGDLSARMTTPMAEFYDAWEELSSESGWQSRRSFFNTEIELRDMRMSLVTEIEQRKQSEEGVKSMRRQCELLREKLASAGLSEADPVEDLCEQVQVTRFVSESIGWAAAKAEAEDEMKAQLEAKNFEIARLSDRLHYYETMNWEMSQRNQEAIENTRRERQKMRRRQELIWGSVGAAITLGTATLVWSFIPTGKGSSSTQPSKSDTNPN